MADSNTITLGGKAVIDAGQLRREFIRNQENPSRFFGKANKYTTHRGFPTGEGWVLLVKKDLDELDVNTTHSLLFQSGSSSATFTVRIAYFQAITGSSNVTPETVYIVRLLDSRSVAKNSAINSSYNLLGIDSVAGSYLTTSKNSGSAWTWTTFLNDLWTNIAGVSSALDLTKASFPTANPEGYDFQGWSAFTALIQVLDDIHHYLILDIDGTYEIQPSGTQTGLAGLLTEHKLDLADPSHDEHGDTYSIPEKFRVFFPKKDFAFQIGVNQDEIPEKTYQKVNAFHVADVNTSTLDSSLSFVTGTVKPLHDGMAATYNTVGTIQNSSAINTRATEIATLALDQLNVSERTLHNRYFGVKPFQPGSEVEAVGFYDLGERMITEVFLSGKEFVSNIPDKVFGPADFTRQHIESEYIVVAKLQGALSVNGSATARIQVGTISGSSISWADTGVPHAITVYETFGVAIPIGTIILCKWLPQVKEWVSLGSASSSWTAEADDNQPAGAMPHTISDGELLDFEGSGGIQDFHSRSVLPHGPIEIGGINQAAIDIQDPLGIFVRTVTVGGVKKVQYCVNDEIAICIKLDFIIGTSGTISGPGTVILFDDHTDHNTFGVNAGDGINLEDLADGTFTISTNDAVITSIALLGNTPLGTNPVVIDDHPTASTLGMTGGTNIQCLGGTGIVTYNLVGTIWTAAGDTGSDPQTPGDTFTIAGGTGITTAVSGSILTITNDATIFASFIAAGDTGSSQTITDGNTLTLAGGINISTVGSATDTITFNLSGTIWTAAGDTGSEGQTPGDTLTFTGGTGITTALAASVLTFNVDSTVATTTANPISFVTSPATATSTILAGETLTIAGGTFITTSISGDVLTIVNDGMQSWTLSADSGSDRMITQANVANFAGLNGITTFVHATDTVDIFIDDTVAQKIVLTDTSGGTQAGDATVNFDNHATANAFELDAGANITLTGVDASGKVTIAAAASSGMASFIAAGDTGSNQTITDGNTLLIEGGTNIATVGAATDKITVNLAGTIWTAAGDSGSDGQAPGDTLTFTGGTNITTSVSGSVLTIASTAGGMTSFNVDGDTGPAQTISDANTLLILGGDGIATVASATDTLTVAVDSTVVRDTDTLLSLVSSPSTVTQTIIKGNTITFVGDTHINPAISATDTVTYTLASTVTTTTDNPITFITSPISESALVFTGGTFSFVEGTGITCDVTGATDLITIGVDSSVVLDTDTLFSVVSSPATVTQTIIKGNTITFVGDTFINPAISATDTVTFTLASTVATTTQQPLTFITNPASQVSEVFTGGTFNFTEGTGITLDVTAATDILTVGVDSTVATTAVNPISFVTSPATATSTILVGETLTIAGGTFITATISGDILTLNSDGMQKWTLSADSGSDREIIQGNVAKFAGLNGITTFVHSPDTVDIFIDDTVAQKVVLTDTSGGTQAGDATVNFTNHATANAFELDAGANITLTGVDASGKVTISAAASSGMASWLIDGDTGPVQTITDGNTVLILGGDGVDTVASATDTLTVAVDSTVARTTDTLFSMVSSPSTVTEVVVAGNTITFVGDTHINPAISATDTVTFTLASTVATTTANPIIFVTSPSTATSTILVGETFTIAGGTNITTSITGDTLTINSSAGGMTSFNVDGNTGPAQTISDSNTLLILGGTGVDTVASATDTLTVAVDSTVVTTTVNPITFITSPASEISEVFGGDTFDFTEGSGITLDITASTDIITIGVDSTVVRDSDTLFSMISSPATVTQTIVKGNTITFVGDTFINPAISATDTVTFTLASTVATTTQNPVKFDTSPATAESTILVGETLTIAGGTNITATISGDILTIASTAGGMTSFNVDGDTGPVQEISDSNTLLILGGTGIDTVASATDTLTVDVDSTVATRTANPIGFTCPNGTNPSVFANASVTFTQGSGITITGTAATDVVDIKVDSTVVTTVINPMIFITSPATATSTILIANEVFTFAGGDGITASISGDVLTITADSFLPIGSVIMWALSLPANPIPTGWAVMDGTANSGPGSGLDLRSRFIQGDSTMTATTGTPGPVAQVDTGSKTTGLTVDPLSGSTGSSSAANTGSKTTGLTVDPLSGSTGSSTDHTHTISSGTVEVQSGSGCVVVSSVTSPTGIETTHTHSMSHGHCITDPGHTHSITHTHNMDHGHCVTDPTHVHASGHPISHSLIFIEKVA